MIFRKKLFFSVKIFFFLFIQNKYLLKKISLCKKIHSV